MALVHYLYIGHFIPEQGYVRFQGHMPNTTRPINMPTVDGLLKKYLGESANLDTLPEEWAMSILPDYIVCNRHGSPAAALNFAADYASQEGADDSRHGGVLTDDARAVTTVCHRVASCPTSLNLRLGQCRQEVGIRTGPSAFSCPARLERRGEPTPDFSIDWHGRPDKTARAPMRSPYRPDRRNFAAHDFLGLHQTALRDTADTPCRERRWRHRHNGPEIAARDQRRCRVPP